jgi:hypothetical protein
MKKRLPGLTVCKPLELPVPDTVSYAEMQNIMLPVFLRFFKIYLNMLNLLLICVYKRKIKIHFYFRGLEQLAT